MNPSPVRLPQRGGRHYRRDTWDSRAPPHGAVRSVSGTNVSSWCREASRLVRRYLPQPLTRRRSRAWRRYLRSGWLASFRRGDTGQAEACTETKSASRLTDRMKEARGMQVNRDLVRATVPPLLAAYVIAAILDSVDDPAPSLEGAAPKAPALTQRTSNLGHPATSPSFDGRAVGGRGASVRPLPALAIAIAQLAADQLPATATQHVPPPHGLCLDAAGGGPDSANTRSAGAQAMHELRLESWQRGRNLSAVAAAALGTGCGWAMPGRSSAVRSITWRGEGDATNGPSRRRTQAPASATARGPRRVLVLSTTLEN